MGGTESGVIDGSLVTIGGRSDLSLCLGTGAAARIAPNALVGASSMGRTTLISFDFGSSTCSVSCNAKHGAMAGPEIVAKMASILILKL